MVYRIIILYIVLCVNVNAQYKSFLIGSNEAGMAFGNPKKNDGIRINCYDQSIGIVNGLDICLFPKVSKLRGVQLSVFNIEYSDKTGVVLQFLGGNSNRVNGISINGVGLVCKKKFNGVAIAGVMIRGEGQFNGVFVSPFGVMISANKKLLKVNGFALGVIGGVLCTNMNGLSLGIHNHVLNKMQGVTVGLRSYAKVFHGVQFGLIYNKAKENSRGSQIGLVNVVSEDFKGIQIGLWNKIGDRAFPIINWRF